MRTLYDHGLPFSKELATNLDDLKERVRIGKASMVIIDGGVGEGKTTLAVHVADYISGYPISLELKYHPQIGMGGEEFVKNLRVCFDSKLAVLIYDEGGDFNRRGALTKFNAMLNRIFETFRAFKIIVIIVLPSFHVLESDLFYKNIPRLLIHCYGRTEEYGNFRAYSLYRMMYVRKKMNELTVKSFGYDQVFPNFRGHFLNLDEKRSAELDNISTKGKIKELVKNEVKMDGLLTLKDLVRDAGVGELTVRKRLKALKIDPAKVISRTNYFPANTLARITEK